MGNAFERTGRPFEKWVGIFAGARWTKAREKLLAAFSPRPDSPKPSIDENPHDAGNNPDQIMAP
jgi:hypothetical protein